MPKTKISAYPASSDGVTQISEPIIFIHASPKSITKAEAWLKLIFTSPQAQKFLAQNNLPPTSVEYEIVDHGISPDAIAWKLRQMRSPQHINIVYIMTHRNINFLGQKNRPAGAQQNKTIT